MTSVPDGVEVVATASDAAALARPPLLVVDRLLTFLDECGLGSGPLGWQRIGDGQSNITYLLERGILSLVLRRGPRPPHPPSTHNMVREARIQQLAGAAGAAVPRILAVCDDESVLGVSFYLMEYLDGVVITDGMPATLDGGTAARRDVVFAAVDALAELHRIDVTRGDLAAFGRPDGYLERQVKLFTSLWGQNSHRSLPQIGELSAWLAAHIPVTQAHAIVHGDYRLGNLMFADSPPARVSAILDWELSTIGDPLADVGYFAATYGASGREGTVMELTSVTREPGFPTRAEALDRYAERSSLDLSPLAWYQALALWKSAIFCEAMYTRWRAGERPGDTFAPTLEAGVPQLISAATAIALV